MHQASSYLYQRHVRGGHEEIDGNFYLKYMLYAYVKEIMFYWLVLRRVMIPNNHEIYHVNIFNREAIALY